VPSVPLVPAQTLMVPNREESNGEKNLRVFICKAFWWHKRHN
jgi:hypothetical protein